MGSSFGQAYVVATILVGLCLVPAFFLPRKPLERAVEPAAVIGG